MLDEEIASLIYRRRQQVWVHSILYYELNVNLIDDNTWSKWALELETLQKDHPDISSQVLYYDIFKNFDHSTGSNLPLDDEKMFKKALMLIQIYDKQRS